MVVRRGVPLPVHAPCQAPPQHAGDERERHEHDADLGARSGDAVEPERVLLTEQVEGRAQGGDREREVRRPDGRDVDVHDAHRVALVAVGRREQQAERRGPPDHHDRGDAEQARGVRAGARRARGGWFGGEGGAGHLVLT